MFLIFLKCMHEWRRTTASAQPQLYSFFPHLSSLLITLLVLIFHRSRFKIIALPLDLHYKTDVSKYGPFLPLQPTRFNHILPFSLIMFLLLNFWTMTISTNHGWMAAVRLSNTILSLISWLLTIFFDIFWHFSYIWQSVNARIHLFRALFSLAQASTLSSKDLERHP